VTDDLYKSKEQVIAELEPLLVEPLGKLIALTAAYIDYEINPHDGRQAYDTFMATLAGYYVRGTAEFYNAGVQAERARRAAEEELWT